MQSQSEIWVRVNKECNYFFFRSRFLNIRYAWSRTIFDDNRSAFMAGMVWFWNKFVLSVVHFRKIEKLEESENL